MDEKTVIVSACLLGLKTRYDGRDARSIEAFKEIGLDHAVPVCPEQLGGLPTPRPKATIDGGTGVDVCGGAARVVNDTGADVTEKFLRGAEAVVEIARITGAEAAYLKEKSPSCGATRTNSGGVEVEGAGVTAELLAREGLTLKGF